MSTRGACRCAGGLLRAGIVSLGCWCARRTGRRRRCIPLSLLRRPTIWRSDALAACHGGALVSLITFLPIYLEVVRGLSPADTGLLLVPLTIGIGTGSLVTGRLVSRTGLTTVFPVLGLALVTVNLVVLALWAQASSITGARLAAVVERAVHGNGDGRRAGDGADRIRAVAARRSGGFGAVLALDRAAFGTAVVAAVLFSVLSLRNPEAARLFAAMAEHGGRICRQAFSAAPGQCARYRGGVPRRVPRCGGVHDRGLDIGAHDSDAADLSRLSNGRSRRLPTPPGPLVRKSPAD